MEFYSVERERKRMKTDEKNEEASPIIPNPQDRTQREPRTPENEGEHSSGMVFRRKKKVNYAGSPISSDSDDYVGDLSIKTQDQNNMSVKRIIRVKAQHVPQYQQSQILEETVTEKDNETTEEARFLFFIRHTLLDFVAMFKYLTPKVLDRDMKERSYIVECLSPILRAFRNAFPEVKYEWIEKDVESIKEVNKIFMSNINHRKTDLLVLRLSDASELLKIEVSGPPYKSTKRHTVDCPIEDAKKVRTYNIQAIGDRITLFAISLAEKKKYLAIELASFIRNEFVEQEKVQRKIRSFIPSADDNTEDLREWLHLPDDDLSLVTDDDMDELFL
ncbi:12915_t:CDS:2 [Funneliformis geosporum]|uniref:12915_t:CDS:1 n=1 Tax=Funneliformis geosporum TaxID=1117311 RepID=A0A9W4STL3_9GLOM|nr:12915_t:CDS:2 [Funneliformis geosporum]